MNSLIVLVVAALAIGSNAAILPLGFGSPLLHVAPSTYTATYSGLSALPALSTLPAVATYSGLSALPALSTLPAVATYSGLSALPAAVPYTPVQSRYHAQDEFGQYAFSFGGGPVARTETRDLYGNVRGSYNYVDPEGKLQTTHYTAGRLGVNIQATNIPVAPEAPAVEAPVAVVDTAEVAEAKLAHKAAHDEATAKALAAVPSRKRRAVTTAIHATPYSFPATISPSGFAYGYSNLLPYASTPAVYSGAVASGFPSVYSGAVHAAAVPTVYTGAVQAAVPAALRDATLTRVILNPGHAVSYRVD